jgi:hypothetical protein
MRVIAELEVVRHLSGVVKMSRLWTDEEDTLLRQICASGDQVSAPVIAQLISAKFSLHPPLTKAAVVGRARRLKVKLPLPRCVRKPFEAKATAQHNFGSMPARRIHEPDRRQQLRGDILPETQEPGVYLLNASDEDCKFPISGKGHLMRVCAEPVERRPYGGVGYCTDCLARVLTREGNESAGRLSLGKSIFVLPIKKKGSL